MSMSQEEIEALMSGAGDIALDEEEDDSTQPENESGEDSSKSSEDNASSEEQNDTTSDSDDTSVASETSEDNQEESQEVEESSGDDTLQPEEENYDDILAGIDGIVDDKSEDSQSAQSSDKSENKVESDLKESIDENMYPMPMNNENKVVSQLNQVADDSEEKASRIFDVLSYILDENNDIANYNKTMGEFLIREAKLLNALSEKFPNIKVFQTNLELANELVDSAEKVNQKITDENNKIFEAMELMQYHDINRQKIERVMAVIKKLNSYLNGIFEDETGKPEVQIAKHIPGDDNETVDAEDLEALINQFSKEEQSS
jgi:hypothetical protein